MSDASANDPRPGGPSAADAARFVWRIAAWTFVAVTVTRLFAGGPVTAAEPPSPAAPQLYQQHCATCHGRDGRGTHRGPTLVGVGAASADFYLRSGRMPLDDAADRPRRGTPAFAGAEIAVLVEYVASLGSGPPIPQVDVTEADVARGGELYRLNCAACHSWDARGGALPHRNAPPLHGIPPGQIAEAIRVGPGPMPRFAADVLDDDELVAVVAYVRYLDTPVDRGGYGIAHWGPATEMVAGMLSLGVLLLFTTWLGKRT